MPDYQIVLTKPDESLVSPQAPAAPNVWDEFLALQLSPATRRSYTAALKDFFQREMGTLVSPEAIGSFLSLSEHEAIGRVLAYRGQLINAGLSAATLNSRLAGLRSFVTHAYKRGLCQFRLADIKSVKAQSYKDTRGVSIELMQLIFSHIDLSTPLGKRNYAMLRLLWDNALRRAEVCGLDREDFFPAEARLLLKGKGQLDKEWIDLAPATVEAISDWLASMGETKSPALFVSSRDTRLSVDRLYQIVGELALAAGIDRVISPHKIRHSSITALLDMTDGDVRSAQAHSRHKNLSTLIRYDDGRQQLQGKAAKKLAESIY
jgi:integrase/recombinase XerC